MHNLEKMLSKMMVLKEEAVAMNDALKRSSIFDKQGGAPLTKRPATDY